jgi:hypothetical protein
LASGELLKDEELMALMNPPPHDQGGPIPTAANAGRLPNRRPDAMWAGRGAGAECDICGVRVETDEPEYELEYIRDAPDAGVDRHHAHVRCLMTFIGKAKGRWSASSRHRT